VRPDCDMFRTDDKLAFSNVRDMVFRVWDMRFRSGRAIAACIGQIWRMVTFRMGGDAVKKYVSRRSHPAFSTAASFASVLFPGAGTTSGFPSRSISTIPSFPTRKNRKTPYGDQSQSSRQ